jgi:hypothetical protein
MEYAPLVALVIMALPFVAEVLFWCFCWCFCTVEGYFQERFMQKIIKNMDRLEKMAASEEKNKAA